MSDVDDTPMIVCEIQCEQANVFMSIYVPDGEAIVSGRMHQFYDFNIYKVQAEYGVSGAHRVFAFAQTVEIVG